MWYAECNNFPYPFSLFFLFLALHVTRHSHFEFPFLAGSYDLKILLQPECSRKDISLPPYFEQFINLKDSFKKFYNNSKAGSGLAKMVRASHTNYTQTTRTRHSRICLPLPITHGPHSHHTCTPHLQTLTNFARLARALNSYIRAAGGFLGAHVGRATS